MKAKIIKKRIVIILLAISAIMSFGPCVIRESIPSALPLGILADGLHIKDVGLVCSINPLFPTYHQRDYYSFVPWFFVIITVIEIVIICVQRFKGVRVLGFVLQLAKYGLPWVIFNSEVLDKIGSSGKYFLSPLGYVLYAFGLAKLIMSFMI